MLSQLGPDGWLVVALLVGAAYAVGWFVGARRREPVAPSPARAPELAAARSEGPVEAAAPVLRPDRATLGRYRIERELGRGSMGTVYLGHDPQIGRAVAIKTMALSREFEGSELAEARGRFFREAEMAGRLRHPDIVTIFDASEDQGLAFIAMEFVDGHDLLRHTLPGKLLPVPEVLQTLARVARALAHAHREGVIHRDVKPANVMIDPVTGTVKVTDFGIARIADACRTRTGLVLGTPSFMSPEQMAGRRVDGRTDLYSLGVMLFQLLTGALPHRSESMATLMSQIVNDTAPDVRSLRPELPEALANVVALALEKRPEVRYGDGHQMADDLLAVAALMDSPVRPVLAPAPHLPASPGVINPPESAGFEATVEFSRGDPRHNRDH
ncbi:MAG: serine/threonine-protein kinase [Burkholderiales bacterium]